MSKKLWSVLVAGALVASVFSTLPASASATIPDVVQIDDPVGDANFLNDQDNAYGTPLEGFGDQDAASIGNATDLMKVWFSNDASEVSLNFQTNGNPGNLVYDTYFRFSSNAGTGPVANDETRGCLQWVASVNGAAGAYTGETEGTFVDKCNVGEVVVGPLDIAEVGDGTFVTTITFPRDASPLLADGGSITTPFGVSRVLFVGPTPTTATAATVDTTQRGEDYLIVSDDGPVVSEPPVMEEPPVVQQPKKKNCKKIQNKKKRKKCIKRNKKLSKPQGCAAYVPGELGAEAETVVLKDDATEEAPVETEFEFGVGIPENPSQEHQQLNVQVDSKSPEAGLYVRFEFADFEDMDLYAYHAIGKEAARAAGYNPAPVPVALGCCDGTGNGGHSEVGAEVLDGIRTSRCGGYTLDLITFQNDSGAKNVKLWLGEIQNDPAPPE